MSVISPPEPASTAPSVQPVPTPPPGYPEHPTGPERYRTPPRDRGVLVGLILITIGIVVLLGTWFPSGGGWIFLGIGAAFLVARVLTGHRGYAVPAGLLLGFGTFVWFTENKVLNPANDGGLFFVFLGLGFLAAYAIAASPQAAWPVIPGMLLIAFGAFIQAMAFGVPFAQFWWLAQYWPLSIVAVGVWLLLRDRLPLETRTPVAIIGVSVLILLGLLVAAASVASVATPYTRGPLPMPWPMFPVPPGTPPIQDTITLSAPTSANESIRLTNTSGSTVVRSTTSSEVTIQATRHYWTTNQPPDVQAVPSGGVLVVQASAIPGTYIDYLVDLPAEMGTDVRSTSGSIAVTGLSGAVRAEADSGGIDARDLVGSATMSTTSGSVRMSNIAGDLRVSSTSGSISGGGVDRVLDAHSTSGSIDLSGDFATSAQVTSTSGSVALKFAPAASVHLDATSQSGDVSASGLQLTAQATRPHALSGNLANGGPTVSVRTTSGSIRLLRGS